MGIWHPHEEMQLVEGCKKNSRIAQQEIFRKLYGKLLGMCLRYSENQEEAQDVLQNGFIKVFQNIGNYKGDGSFEGWIKRIVVNTAIDNYRRKKTRGVQVNSDLAERVGSHMAEEEDAESIYNQVPVKEVLAAVQKLSPAYQAVFNLYVMEGYSHNEISEMLQISVGTSKSNLSKARLNLQKMLRPLIKNLQE